MNLLPGNAAQRAARRQRHPAEVRALEIRLHLNQPFWIRYLDWLGGVLPGDLGTSFTSGQPVTSILAQRLPVTLELLLYAFLISSASRCRSPRLAARRPGGMADRVSMVTSMAGLSSRRTCWAWC